jgi:hypothetical protein
MKRRTASFYSDLVGVNLVLVGLVWYASENFTGRLGATVERPGCHVI